MMISLRLLPLTLACIGALCGTALAGPSSFQRSCDGIRLSADDEGAWITAECRTRRGDSRQTSIEVQGIANIDGQLRRERKRESSFQRSCRNIRLSWEEESVTLSAICRTMAGAERHTAIALADIHNIDGRLTISR